MDELLGDFLTETAENLAVADNEIVRWERNPSDRATLDNIFRLVHTIKGTCGFLDLPRLEALAHAAETALGRVRDGKIAVSAGLVTGVLAALDGIKAILRALEADGKEPAGDDAALVERLERAAMGEDSPEAEEIESVPVEPHAPGRAVQTIRVSVDLLEHLMTTVSEMVLARNQLMQLVRRDGSVEALALPLQRLSQCVTEIQDSVMRTRMQPVSNAWATLPRLVRSLALELGKRIEIEMTGGETDLDRQVLEVIKDPLAHMVRNAADHGLETPRERILAGKREAGRIRLNAYQEGGQIVIEMSDDGRGIDVERLKEKAVEAGLLRPSEAAELSRAQASKLMFHPGLSTAQQVTSISGRGVGMDVVKANIEKIGGSVEVDSTPGRGTRFTLRIPLTLAIVPALVLSAGGERFAVPQMAVLELVRADAEHRIERVHDTEVLRLRGRLLPLVDLSRLLGLPDAAGEDRFIVVAQAGGFSFGLVVDDLFDTEEIVVKPVAPILAGLPVYSGNAILGDGHVIVILDVNGIAGMAGLRGEAEDGERDEAGEASDGEHDSMLVFRAGSNATPMAVPLSLVARLEDLAADSFEWSEGRPVVQYRGDLMPILGVDGPAELRAERRQPVLVFGNGEHHVGLAVDEVLDIVETRIDIRMSGDVEGRLGSAVIAGRVTEILDVGHYLELGLRRGAQGGTGAELLVVDDSAFFRNMLRPLLASAGYAVTTAASAEEALRLREAGRSFDLILSDIEMPGLSGIDFARAVRSGGGWARTPIVALSSVTGEAGVPRAAETEFDDFVPKFDRASLLSMLETRLAEQAA